MINISTHEELKCISHIIHLQNGIDHKKTNEYAIHDKVPTQIPPQHKIVYKAPYEVFIKAIWSKGSMSKKLAEDESTHTQSLIKRS